MEKKYLQTEQGFTLIELILVLGILSIVVSLGMYFFTFNLRTYKMANNNSEIQFQAQYVTNFMTNKIMECKKIVVAKKNTTSYLNSLAENEVYKISFQYGDSDMDCYNFQYKNNENKIFYGHGEALYINSANAELGTYISNMYISPMPKGTALKDAKAVKIRLVLKKDSEVYETESVIYMRNTKDFY